MYIRNPHAEHDLSALRTFISANPLGILTTAIESPTYPTIQSSHIPFILDTPDKKDESGLGALRGHFARANPQSKAMIESLAAEVPKGGPACLEKEVLVIFNGPIHHYITPKFYKETKPATGKVVPTWNYAAVQVYGKATVFFDHKHPDTDAFLSKQVSDLSEFCETTIMGYQQPWRTSDAPAPYMDLMKKAIVGIHIDISSIEGKWKMSQEMAHGDRMGVVEGFELLGTDVGRDIAMCVKERSQLSEEKKGR